MLLVKRQNLPQAEKMELSGEIAIAKAITRKPRQHTSFDGGEVYGLKACTLPAGKT